MKKTLPSNKIKNLRKLFEKFKKIPFPGFVTNEGLVLVYSDLATYDGLVGGTVSRLFSDGKTFKPEDLFDVRKIDEQLLAFKPQNKQEEEQIGKLKKYYQVLQKLVRMYNETIKKI